MKAIVYGSTHGGSALVMSDIPRQDLPAGALRIKVHASSVNRADYLKLRGKYPHSGIGVQNVAGIDAAGEVIDASPEITSFRTGDRVMAMVSGGLAEEIVLPAGSAVKIPDGWSYAEGAAGIIGLMTEHNALSTVGRIKQGDSVLIHAAASGVGSQAVKMAYILGASSVFGTTRSEHKELSFDSGLNYRGIITAEENFADRIIEDTQGAGVDLIIDHVGGPYLSDNIRASALGGRIISVGRLGGREGLVDMEEMARKRLELIGVTFRTRRQSDKENIVADLLAEIDLPSVADDLRPRISRLLPWTSATDPRFSLIPEYSDGKTVFTISP